MGYGSTNGTVVNDKDVLREKPTDGDVITFGMTKAAFVGDKPKARVNPNRVAAASAGRGAAAPAARPGTQPSSRPLAPAAARGGAAPAAVGHQVTVTDQPRRSAQPLLRCQLKTQD